MSLTAYVYGEFVFLHFGSPVQLKPHQSLRIFSQNQTMQSNVSTMPLPRYAP